MGTLSARCWPMGMVVDALGKQTTLYNENLIPAVYRFLPSVRRIVHQADAPSAYDTAVILDCGDLKRIGRLHADAARMPNLINIDHHVTNSGFGDLTLIDTGACATAEIVYRLIRRMEIPISPAMAASIYTGILTDTGSFRFSNTNRAAFDICSEMVRLGVDPYSVAQQVYGTYSLGRIKLLNLAIDSIEISRNGKLSVMTLYQDMLDETGDPARRHRRSDQLCQTHRRCKGRGADSGAFAGHPQNKGVPVPCQPAFRWNGRCGRNCGILRRRRSFQCRRLLRRYQHDRFEKTDIRHGPEHLTGYRTA